jgi:hypothetical protein
MRRRGWRPGRWRCSSGCCAGRGGREDALALLAADALLTHALEAQAELDPDGVAEFAARCLSCLQQETVDG